MNWSDYEAVWKRQELPRGEAADVESLRASFETKHRKMSAAFLFRDFAEAGAGVFVCIAFAGIWVSAGIAGWPIGVAMLLVLGVSGFFLRERLRARRRRVAETAPMLAKVSADLAELRHQRRLLLAVWAWYLGPLLAAILLVHGTLCCSAPAGDLRRDPYFNAGVLAFYLATMFFAWAINRRAVRREIEPRLAELEKLQRELTAAE